MPLQLLSHEGQLAAQAQKLVTPEGTVAVPIALISKASTLAARKRTTTEQELCALIHTLKKLEALLMLKPSIRETDHQLRLRTQPSSRFVKDSNDRTKVSKLDCPVLCSVRCMQKCRFQIHAFLELSTDSERNTLIASSVQKNRLTAQADQVLVNETLSERRTPTKGSDISYHNEAGSLLDEIKQ